jgi:hypothetical protein
MASFAWIARGASGTALGLLLACGSSEGSSSSSGGTGPSDAGGGEAKAAVSTDCPGVSALLCTRAGECTGGGKAIVSTSGATAEHATVTECKTYYAALQCPSATTDWAACKSALEGASCTSTSKGSTLAIPSACKGLGL